MSERRCIGCGVKLQDKNITQEGYTSNLENSICNRCFRLKNYGEYQIVTKSNDDFIKILKGVNKTKDLVLYIEDILNIGEDLSEIRKYITNKMILVLNKRDVLPRSIKDEKIIEYFKKLNLDFQDVIIVSTSKNYNFDELLSMIKKYKTSKNVYVVGNTNVGKSSLINKLMKDYSEYEGELTISPMPSTTLNKITIKMSDDLYLIDTPGLIDRGNIINFIDKSEYKKISPKKEIKPKTYQIRPGQCLVVGDFFRIDYVEGEKNSFTFFVSNDLKIKKYFNMSKCNKARDYPKKSFEIGFHEDLVISGLGFIKIVNEAKIDVYADINIKEFQRDSLI